MKVTDAEEAVLVRLAEAAGVSVPRLLVEAAVAGDTAGGGAGGAGGAGVTATERRDTIVELMTVSRVLAGVATNLNQLARSVNAGAEFPPAAVVVRERIRDLIPRIQRACEDLSDPGNPDPLRLPPGRPGARGLGDSRGPVLPGDRAAAPSGGGSR